MQLPGDKAPKVTGQFDKAVTQQERRLTGVTPKVTKAYVDKPWKYLPRAGSLKVSAGGGRMPKLK